jgi:hypothetical protein
MWNEWNLDLVDEFVAPELILRGSLGTLVQAGRAPTLPREARRE